MMDMEKELADKQGKRSSAVFLSLVLVMLIFVGIMNVLVSSSSADEGHDEPYLYVEDVFFLLSGQQGNQNGGSVTIDVTAFVTNKGDLDAKDVEIIAFVVDEDTNLALDKTTFVVGPIGKEKTHGSEFSLSIPNDKSYNIKLIIMEDGKIAVRGSGIVNLYSGYGDSGNSFRTDPIGRGSDDLLAEGLTGTVFSSGGAVYGIFLIVIAVIVLLVLIARRRSSSTREYLNPSTSTQGYGEAKENVTDPSTYGTPYATEVMSFKSENETALETDTPSNIEDNGDMD